MLIATAGVGALALSGAEAEEAEERKIGKEPTYVSDRPLYGLYVLDSERKTKVWAVLDKGEEAGSRYDVLYFDKNANGDLTEEGEKFAFLSK